MNPTNTKQYMDVLEFEHLLRLNSMTEVQFLAEAGLGMYTVREWRRTFRIPAWAGTLLRYRLQARTGQTLEQAKENAATSKKTDPVILEMTESETLKWGMMSAKDGEKFYNEVKARLELKQASPEIIPYEGAPAFTPDKPLEF